MYCSTTSTMCPQRAADTCTAPLSPFPSSTVTMDVAMLPPVWRLQSSPSGFALAMGMVDQHLLRPVDRLLKPEAAAVGSQPANRCHRVYRSNRHSCLLRK